MNLCLLIISVLTLCLALLASSEELWPAAPDGEGGVNRPGGTPDDSGKEISARTVPPFVIPRTAAGTRPLP